MKYMKSSKFPLFFFDYDRSSNTLKIEEADGDMSSPNGVARNHDSSEIYVVDSKSKAINIFKRDTKTNKLEKTEVIDSVHTCDNIKFDPESKTLHAGTSVYALGKLMAMKDMHKKSDKSVGGLTEYGRDPKTNQWW